MTLDRWTISDTPAHDDFGAYAYREAHDGSGEETYSNDSSTAQMAYCVDWSQRFNFIDDLLGWAVELAAGGIHRELPEQHPTLVNFFAADAKVSKIGQPSMEDGVSVWPKAIITASFKPQIYDILEDDEVSSELDRYVQREYDEAGEFCSVFGQMKFVTPVGGKVVALPIQPQKPIYSTQVTYTWLQVPADPGDPFSVPTQAAINACIGRVNSADFDGYPAGTVLFVKPESRMATPKLGTGDVFYWTIKYTMLYRDNGSVLGERAGHNFFFNITSGAWDLITDDGTVLGHRLYDSADLNTLFVI